jgi:predicted nucleotidyltransferase
MASKTNIIRTLKALFSELKKDRVIEIKSAYLFGSVVKEKNTKYSDIDLAIISDSFTGCRYDDRVKLNPYIMKINTNVEIHPFTTKEFKVDNPFAKEIIKNGQRIL